MTVRDESGKATTAKPFVGEANKNIQQQFTKILPMQFVLPINRSGKFTIELKATDKISNKTAKLTFPVTVLEQK